MNDTKQDVAPALEPGGRKPRRTPVAPAQQQMPLAPVERREAPARVTMSPMDMIAMAVERGTSIDELNKLWDIAEKVRQQQAASAYVQAMNLFKQDPPTIEKTRTANVDKKNGGGFSHAYKYANLADVCGAVVRALAAVNISHSWTTLQKDGAVAVTCTLTHEQGHSTSTMLAASLDTTGSKNNLQALGSTVSYLERYTLLAACGLAVDDEQDNDGASAEDRAELQQLAGEMRAGVVTPVMPLLAQAQAAADKGHMALGDFLRSLDVAQRRTLGPAMDGLQQRASAAKVR